jgi:hypothetical protein
MVALPLVPFLYPERLLYSRCRSGVGRYATAAEGPRIPRKRWSEVAARAKAVGLRVTAREFGISNETIRAVVRQVFPITE